MQTRTLGGMSLGRCATLTKFNQKSHTIALKNSVHYQTMNDSVRVREVGTLNVWV